jgi:hypothetical protein
MKFKFIILIMYAQAQHRIHLLNEIQIYSIIHVAHKFSVIHKNFNQ